MVKDFKGGLGSLVNKEPAATPKKRGRPKTQKREITKSSQEGTKLNETRATFIVNEEQLDKLKAVAYWERLKIKEVVSRALEDYIKKYEKKNGEVKPLEGK